VEAEIPSSVAAFYLYRLAYSVYSYMYAPCPQERNKTKLDKWVYNAENNLIAALRKAYRRSSELERSSLNKRSLVSV